MPEPAGMTPRCRKLNSGVTAPRLRSAVNDMLLAPPWTADNCRYAAGSVCAIRCASAGAGLCAPTGISVRAAATIARSACLIGSTSVHPGRMTESVDPGLDGPDRCCADNVKHAVVASPEGDA